MVRFNFSHLARPVYVCSLNLCQRPNQNRMLKSRVGIAERFPIVSSDRNVPHFFCLVACAGSTPLFGGRQNAEMGRLVPRQSKTPQSQQKEDLCLIFLPGQIFVLNEMQAASTIKTARRPFAAFSKMGPENSLNVRCNSVWDAAQQGLISNKLEECRLELVGGWVRHRSNQ